MEEVKKTQAEEARELREAIMAEACAMTDEQRKMFILFLEAIVGERRG